MATSYNIPEGSQSLPDVAVVIPCWNAERWIALAIQSVLDQGYPNIEVIVIDDGSTDGSLDVIRSFGNKIRWETGPNRGACAARNRGLAMTEAEYVVFLDADDWLVPGAIQRQVDRATALDPASKTIVFGDAIATDAGGQHIGQSPKPWMVDGELASKVCVFLNKVPGTTAPLHRRTYLLDIQGFREDLPAGQEYDLHVRLHKQGISFLYHAAPIYYARQHASPDRISNRVKVSDKYWRNIKGVYRSLNSERDQLSPKERVIIAKHAWECGRYCLRVGIPEGVEFFRLAREVSPEQFIFGGRLYRVAYNVLGAAWAERLARLKTSTASALRTRTRP